ncbi:MAG: DUF4433 domain-containing protein [Nitrospirae bacterium]|nr:DUF4433 domain-containing protein [Nitrospirota bacterium]
MKLKESDIDELYFIAPIDNVASILKKGLLSHNMMKKLAITHVSVASGDVQARRVDKVVPGGRKLHDYVNIYLNARNSMLYSLLDRQKEICVLRIDRKVMRLQKAIISDENAARGWAKFQPSPDGLEMIDKEELFGLSWNHPDPFEKDRLKGLMCAEVLVPEKVSAKYILGAYVSCQEAGVTLADLCPDLDVKINGQIFFQ